MKIIRHITITLLILAVLLGTPLTVSGYLQRSLSGEDAVSSASTVIEQPSGAYAVFINRDHHTDDEALAVWTDFFSGREIDYLFEDISCVVADSDSFSLELAESFRSRLPENQMTIRSEETTLFISKLEAGIYDVAIVSEELYEEYLSADDFDPSETLVIKEDGV